MGRYPKPTKAEAERIQKMMKLGCVACAAIMHPRPATECHHILEGHKRLGHWYTLPLCAGHHRGTWDWGDVVILDATQMVSIADGRKAFTKIYPSERELWERVQKRLHLPVLWPVSKILPRREMPT